MPDEILRAFQAHAEDDKRVFEQLQLGQQQILAEIRVITGQVQDVMAELGGVPQRDYRGNRETVRDRLHRIESDGQAAKAVREALEVLRSQQAATELRRWGSWEKRATILGVMVAASTSVARVFGVSI